MQDQGMGFFPAISAGHRMPKSVIAAIATTSASGAVENDETPPLLGFVAVSNGLPPWPAA
ncbi:hypothetical protein Tdes44962_MAKER02338 [Teratosphaeria destructans]|uniref:Uncharacterized protein n=1 Tax=Teratosphaeria destructans TaxID=418781 RepID=A0A9W7W3P8_9PEZI|nr:hypothetical protein Tdes44962_MAKER02338 [Teratosphaeria destructans]